MTENDKKFRAIGLVATTIITGIIIFGFNMKHNLIINSVFYTCAGLIPLSPALLKDGGVSADEWMRKHPIVSIILMIVWIGFLCYFTIETTNGNLFG